MRRITKALLATTAAGAASVALGLTAGPASAAASHPHPAYFTPTGGTPIPTNANCPSSGITPSADTVGSPSACGMAGYVDSGRDFRFVQAQITVPDHNGSGSDPWEFVALDNSTSTTSNWARAGVIPCGCGPSGWEWFYATWEPTGSSPSIQAFALPVNDEGDGITVNAYETPNQNSVQFTFTFPGGSVRNYTAPITGETYTRAEWLVDWSIDSAHPAPAPPPAKTRVTQFLNARATTFSGVASTITGPWSTNGAQATSNGHLAPNGTLIGDPSYLWNDGNGYHGLGNDAFGAWLYPF